MPSKQADGVKIHSVLHVNYEPIGKWLSVLLLTFGSLTPFSIDPPIWFLLTAAVFLSLLVRREALKDMRVSIWVLTHMSWVSLSLLWSVAPSLTFNNVVRLALTTSFGFAVATRRNLGQILEIAAISAGCVLAGCWAYAIIAPGSAYSQDGADYGAFKGLMVQKNGMGFFAVYASVALACQAVRVGRSRSRYAYAAAACVGAVSVLATTSGTALTILFAVGVTGLALGLVGRTRYPRGLAFVSTVGPLAVALAILVGNPDIVTTSLGKDPTLTGRTKIWEVVGAAIAQRPLIGYGWGALWHAGTPETEALWAENGYPFYHSHNGYLDITAQVGLIGTVIVFGLLAFRLVGGVFEFLSRPSGEVAYPCLFIVMLLAYNATEVVGFRDTMWMMTVIVAVLGPVERGQVRVC